MGREGKSPASRSQVFDSWGVGGVKLLSGTESPAVEMTTFMSGVPRKNNMTS